MNRLSNKKFQVKYSKISISDICLTMVNVVIFRDDPLTTAPDTPIYPLPPHQSTSPPPHHFPNSGPLPPHFPFLILTQFYVADFQAMSLYVSLKSSWLFFYVYVFLGAGAGEGGALFALSNFKILNMYPIEIKIIDKINRDKEIKRQTFLSMVRFEIIPLKQRQRPDLL